MGYHGHDVVLANYRTRFMGNDNRKEPHTLDMTTPLKSRIIKHIKTSGSLPLAEYMHWCMADPTNGYYANQEAIGSKGDFITAPEISQMFGEMIGIWAVETWEVPDFLKAAEVQMIETSEKLIKSQKQTLREYDIINWHKSIKDIPNQPTLIIANEFLDVLPVRQYVKTNDEWREHAINVDENDELVWTLGTGILDADSLPENARNEPEGAIFEISTIREAFIANASELLKENSGAALFIDYGHTKTDFGDTVQAMRAHGFVDILAEPGMADLTAHVDFGALSQIAKSSGMNVKPIIKQGEFLLSKGLIERAGQTHWRCFHRHI